MEVDLDKAPVASGALHSEVPVVNLREDHAHLVADIAAACEQWGFFQIVGHGVPAGKFAETIAAARAFFHQPRDEKRHYQRSRDNPWGYYDRELTKEKRDRKEIFDIGPDFGGAARGGTDPFEGQTPEPLKPADFTPAMRRWFEHADALSARLTSLIAEGLTGNPDVLAPAFEPGHTSYLRLNFYPLGDPLAEEQGSQADLGIHHHTDAGALTVLLQDGISGLQVYRDGYWFDVRPIEGAFTINIGDMTQVWSNDRYKAPVHRVLAMEQAERISIPYFYNPSYETTVAPLVGSPLYDPIGWGEFRRRRADGDFADYGTEVQISQFRRAA